MRKFLGFTLAVGILSFFAVAIAIISDKRIAKLVQTGANIPGSYFVIGSAEFAARRDWLLTAYKPGKDQYIRVYGIFPSLRSDSLSGRYFEFLDTSATAETKFAFIETDPAFNARLRKVLHNSAILSDGVNKCAIWENISAELSGIVCPIEGGSITYLPEVGVYLILYSRGADPRQYLLPSKR